MRSTTESFSMRSRINLACSAFSRLQSCLWSRCEISLHAKGRVCRAAVRSILLYVRKIWPVRVANERMLEVFDNDSICRILHMRCRDCVSSVEQRRRLCHTSTSALLMQRGLLFVWARRKTSRRRTDQGFTSAHTTSHVAQANWSQLKTWATTIKADLAPLFGPRVFGYARWRKETG